MWALLQPALMVLASPLVVGIFFGKQAICGLIIGSILGGLPLALSTSASGGAWQNAKKYVESTESDHWWNGIVNTSVSVGEPLMMTAGAAINIVMNLMAILSLVAAPIFASIRDGYGLIGCSIDKECTA